MKKKKKLKKRITKKKKKLKKRTAKKKPVNKTNIKAFRATPSVWIALSKLPDRQVSEFINRALEKELKAETITCPTCNGVGRIKKMKTKSNVVLLKKVSKKTKY